MAKIYGTPLMMGGGGGQNLTLPPMVTNLTAKGSNATITVSWTNPTSDALAGIAVVYNSDHEPERPSDGTKVDAGLVETIDLTGLDNGTLYYIRIFPYNEKKQYQTLIDGATTTARPSEGPQQVTNLQVSGSGASPVLTWENPTDDPTYHETVVIQKVDNPPTSLSDGSEIYRGTGETVSANGLERLKNYYWGVFTVNAEGGTRGPVVSDVYSYDFPAEPTEWSEVTTLTSSEEYHFPETGYFKIEMYSASGDGGDCTSVVSGGTKYRVTPGAGGGSGAFASHKVTVTQGETIQINIDADISLSEPVITVYGGKNANGGHPGVGGRVEGIPNIEKIDGVSGTSGTTTIVDVAYPPQSVNGGKGGSTDKVLAGGAGGAFNVSVSGAITNGKGSSGEKSKVIIYRGNTNTPSPSTASTLSLLPTDSTLTVDWTNSGDPVQTGTMLVYNTSHTPKSPSDGVAVDIPLTQPVTLALNSDNEELQEDSKKQSYTITGVSNDKPVFVALFPYDKNRKYGLAKQEVEIPREHSWYDKQQELKQEVQEATEQAEQAQETVTMTRDFLPDAIALTMPQVYDEWDPNSIEYTGKDYATENDPADIVRYQELLYRCIQSHTSQEGWNPKDAVSLWVRIADPAEEYPEWVQPTGAHDAYAQGAKVSHNGKKWTSNIAANVWEPGVYGWTEVIE